MSGSTFILTLAQTTKPSGPTNIWQSFSLGDTLTHTPLTAWLILLAGVFAGVVSGKLAQALLRSAAERMMARNWAMRATFLRGAAGPASLALLTFGASLGVGGIIMSDSLEKLCFKLMQLLYISSLGWLIYNLVDVLDVGLQRLTAKTETTLDDQVVPLVRKTLKVFVVILFSLFVAENVFGANIGAWLAGLGIAGLAVSLAAQDSIKNFFGSITILLDHPFRLNDRILVDGQDGVVEEIGFRSTKVRMLTGELVTIPNAKVADSNVLNYTRRPNLRRVMNVTITYDTPPQKIEEAVQIVREILAEPDIAAALDLPANPPRVYFDELNADSLNIKVFYWFRGTDWWAYMEHCQKVNMQLMRRYAKAGIEMAFPTRTLYLAGDTQRKLRVHLAGQPQDGTVVPSRTLPPVS